ncbi:MAG: cupin domain-containing protein [Alphaproteobacteria bacterium]|nr:MAG: cupin domain-containing protein [Alphaproteobacteria bacterium]
MFKSANSREFLTRERCHITELFNVPEAPDASLARARVEPGVTTELHALSVHERYIIEQGTGLMDLAEAEDFMVGPGDVIDIVPGRAQRITNTGAGDLIFLCLCTPRFEPECYQPLEESP